MFVCSAASRLDCRFMCYVKHLFAASLKFNYICVTERADPAVPSS